MRICGSQETEHRWNMYSVHILQKCKQKVFWGLRRKNIQSGL